MSAELQAACNNNPRLKAALSDFLQEQESVALRQLAAAQLADDLFRAQGAARKVQQLLSTIDKW